MKNQAFTLIELLVVVLIIGILAAIAVPQNQRAVNKSKMSQAFITLKAIDDAQKVYYLANGKYSTKLANLDIFSHEVTPSGEYDYIAYDDVYFNQYILDGESKSISMWDNANILPRMEKYYYVDYIHC